MPQPEESAPPSRRARRAFLAALWPVERLLRPRFFGFDELTRERPLMVIGNHQLLALDTPFLMAELWRRGLFVHPLADDFLFALPPLARLLEPLGLLPASPERANALLSRGESILVYPGGAREAVKGDGRGFSLGWWDRLGFARLALERRATIVTVAATGIDDRMRVLASRDDYLAGPLSRPINALHFRHDLLPPVVLPKALPRPTFKLGEPIAIDHFFGHDEESAVRRLRAEVAARIDADLRWLAEAA